MGRAKIVYLDEYRRARQYRSLLRMIEGHLAEAARLRKASCESCNSSHGTDERWQRWNPDNGAGEKDF